MCLFQHIPTHGLLCCAWSACLLRPFSIQLVGAAVSRSTFNFLPLAHFRAQFLTCPSRFVLPQTYTRGGQEERAALPNSQVIQSTLSTSIKFVSLLRSVLLLFCYLSCVAVYVTYLNGSPLDRLLSSVTFYPSRLKDCLLRPRAHKFNYSIERWISVQSHHQCNSIGFVLVLKQENQTFSINRNQGGFPRVIFHNLLALAFEFLFAGRSLDLCADGRCYLTSPLLSRTLARDVVATSSSWIVYHKEYTYTLKLNIGIQEKVYTAIWWLVCWIVQRSWGDDGRSKLH